MSELEYLCQTYTKLTDADIRQLKDVERQLPLIAELTNADAFLDCLVDTQTAVVVAHARPSQRASAYQKKVVGEQAVADKEPAVFHAFRIGMPVCDLKAITQENRAVRQNVAPVRNHAGQVIAVLIREKDISDGIRQEQKYEELARIYEGSSVLAAQQADQNAAAMREVHHRIKNNLQLVASILNLQARRNEDSQLQLVLKENVSRVLSIAAIHDILTHVSEDMRTIQSDSLLSQLCRNLQALIPANKEIHLTTEGDVISMTADVATPVALVVTELVINAFRHAFEDRSSGQVIVSVCSGTLFHTVTVADNGSGFVLHAREKNSLGLRIVDATVQEKLKGKLHISSDIHGTKVSFDFKRE